MPNFIKEFVDFISKGNVIDMAIGVIIGGAFNNIITSLVNIILSICTWAVPGGLKGVITILPAVSKSQKGFRPEVTISKDEGLGQKFKKDNLQNVSKALANYFYHEEDPEVIEIIKGSILKMYDLHGQTYTYKNSAIIDWGTLIFSILSFLIIGLTLFLIVKFIGFTKGTSKKLGKTEENEKEKNETELKTIKEDNPTERNIHVRENSETERIAKTENEGVTNRDSSDREQILNTFDKEKDKDNDIEQEKDKGDAIRSVIYLMQDICDKLSEIQIKLANKN